MHLPQARLLHTCIYTYNHSPRGIFREKQSAECSWLLVTDGIYTTASLQPPTAWWNLVQALFFRPHLSSPSRIIPFFLLLLAAAGMRLGRRCRASAASRCLFLFGGGKSSKCFPEPLASHDARLELGGWHCAISTRSISLRTHSFASRAFSGIFTDARSFWLAKFYIGGLVCKRTLWGLVICEWLWVFLERGNSKFIG